MRDSGGSAQVSCLADALLRPVRRVGARGLLVHGLV